VQTGLTTLRGAGALLCIAAVLAACATDKADLPVKLEKIQSTLVVERSWDTSLGSAVPKLRLGLGLAGANGVVYAGNHSGEALAFSAANGKRLWQTKLKKPLSAGPGVGEGLAIFGTSKGELIALDAATGAKRWDVWLGSELLSAPAIGSKLVVVRTVDGKLHGLQSTDGSELWVTSETLPKLTLRGIAEPVIVKDLALSGFDNGRVLAVSLGNGNTAWDVAVAQSHGSSELQRLVDIDSTVVVDGDDLYAVSFQGRIARMATETGQVLWTHDISSYAGLAVDADNVYISTAEGDVVGLDRRTGTEQWRQKALERRQLTAPVLAEPGVVVVGDFEGVVHWLDAGSGKFLARSETGKRIRATPIVEGGRLFVLNDGGKLTAYAAKAAPATAAAAAKPPAVTP
jgi:outer membrane protein assembly factor BamB